MARAKVIQTFFGSGWWVMESDPSEIARLKKLQGMTHLELKVSSYPNDKLTLEELFQEHVLPEEWPRASAVLSNVKGCMMSNVAVTIIGYLLQGDKPWDGMPIEEE